ADSRGDRVAPARRLQGEVTLAPEQDGRARRALRHGEGYNPFEDFARVAALAEWRHVDHPRSNRHGGDHRGRSRRGQKVYPEILLQRPQRLQTSNLQSIHQELTDRLSRHETLVSSLPSRRCYAA